MLYGVVNDGFALLGFFVLQGVSLFFFFRAGAGLGQHGLQGILEGCVQGFLRSLGGGKIVRGRGQQIAQLGRRGKQFRGGAELVLQSQQSRSGKPQPFAQGQGLGLRYRNAGALVQPGDKVLNKRQGFRAVALQHEGLGVVVQHAGGIDFFQQRSNGGLFVVAQLRRAAAGFEAGQHHGQACAVGLIGQGVQAFQAFI